MLGVQGFGAVADGYDPEVAEQRPRADFRLALTREAVSLKWGCRIVKGRREAMRYGSVQIRPSAARTSQMPKSQLNFGCFRVVCKKFS